MKVYIVRHGESTANVSHIHQTPDEELTERGKQQAIEVAHRFTDICIAKIISSPYKRAINTALEIQKTTDAKIEKNDLFVEVKRPSELAGTLRTSPGAQVVFDEIYKHAHDEKWHYSDEENFSDFKKRVKKAITFLENQTYEEFAVVTHSVFLRMLIGLLAFKEDMSPEILKDLGDFFKIHNTSITMLEYTNAEWKLLTWNDFAHLG